MLVLPADHLITDLGAFSHAVDRARQLAEQGWLVTFGILPTRAETGFGYIEKGPALNADSFNVAQFVEKPDALTAVVAAAALVRALESGRVSCVRRSQLVVMVRT